MKAGSSSPEPAHDTELSFRALANSTPMPMWTTAADGAVSFVNRALAETAGLPGEQLLGDAWLGLLHPDDTPAVVELRAAAWRDGHAPYEFVARFRNAAGAWRRLRATAQPRFGVDGAFLGYVGMAVDESIARSAPGEAAEEGGEPKTAEAPAPVIEQFRLLVQGVVDYALYLIDPSGRVTTWNAGAARIKGYAASEIIGRHFSVFYTPEDREAGVPDVALETARSTGRYEKEGWRVRKDGSRFLANVVIDAITDDDGKLIGFAKITRDITEQRRAAQELEDTREALIQAQKMEMVGQLTGGLAHDFNNMLAGIIGGLNLLQRRLSAGRTDDVGKYIDAALASAHRAASLTSRLLAFGRRQTLDIKPIDIAAAVNSMAILLSRSIGENIRLDMQLKPGVALTDANQLEAALLNLAVNARDAMPNGGALTIETGPAMEGYVGILVRDTGVGMTPDVLEKAFNPFFTTKPIGQGTGLGLSMVHGFVNQSGGDIAITSTPGEGTSVRLLLPVAERAPAAAEPKAAQAERGAGETVLVVEDDAQVRMLVLEVLRELGYSTLEANDAREALALLDQTQVDLLVSDVGLPGLSGRQLADIARARAPALKVLFITGYAEHARVRSSFLESGMDLVTKPFELDAFAAKIREMMAMP